MNVMRAAVLAACLAIPEVCSAPGPDQIFRWTARAFWKAAGRCWATPLTGNYDLDEVIEGSLEAADWWWPGDHSKAWVLFYLSITERENLKDPSYGPFGITLPAARGVRDRLKREGREPMLCFPDDDSKLSQKLSSNHRFNAYVGAGILKWVWDKLPPNYETIAVLSYKLGPRGDFNGRPAMIRKKHYWSVRRQVRCLAERVRSGKRKHCECMK